MSRTQKWGNCWFFTYPDLPQSNQSWAKFHYSPPFSKQLAKHIAGKTFVSFGTDSLLSWHTLVNWRLVYKFFEESIKSIYNFKPEHFRNYTSIVSSFLGSQSWERFDRGFTQYLSIRFFLKGFVFDYFRKIALHQMKTNCANGWRCKKWRIRQKCSKTLWQIKTSLNSKITSQWDRSS